MLFAMINSFLDSTFPAITGATAAATSTAASVPATEAEEAAPLRAWILPLYALMPAALQNRVFLPPPPGRHMGFACMLQNMMTIVLY